MKKSNKKLADKYDIQEKLGSGGMGIVYKAYDKENDRDVAIKILSPLKNKEENRSRLRREFRSLSNLEHPNIIKVYEYEIQSQNSYLVMEYLSGKNLIQWRKEQTHVETDKILDIIYQICSALEYIHSSGIIHRDLKPQNLMFVDETHEKMKLMDFGLVHTSYDTQIITHTGDMLGTPAYMSPEIISGKKADYRSDIYSLGIILYELLAGHLPFSGNLFSVIYKQTNEPPPPLPSNLKIPKLLAKMLFKTLKKDPADRFQSVTEIIHILSELSPTQISEPSRKIPRKADQIYQSNLTGRTDQLNKIHEILKKTMENPQILFIFGNFGSGKSRLMNEAIANFRDMNIKFLKIKLKKDETLAYNAISKITHKLIRLVFTKKYENLKMTLKDYAGEIIKVAPQLTNYEDFGDISPSQALGQAEDKLRLFESIRAFWVKCSREFAFAIIVDNLEFIDELSLEFLSYFIHNMNANPILLTFLGIKRNFSSPLKDAINTWQALSNATTLSLKNLSKSDVKKMVQTMLYGVDVSENIIELIYRKTEGNPFFVTEVVKMIVEDGMIYQKNAKWRTDSTNKFRIPATIRDVVINRLEALDAEARKTLKFAAVIGFEFSFDVLLEIVKKDEDGLLDDIEELLRSELIKEIPHSAYDRYKFNSSAVQEVLYSSHNRRRLKLLHEKIAHAIEKIYHHQLEEKTEILAYHYYRGKDMENAIKYLLKRGEKAETAYDYSVALESYTKAIKSAQRLTDSQKLIHVYLKRGNLYRKQADYDPALEDLERVKDLSEDINDNQLRGIALSDMGAIYTDLNDLKKAKIYLEQAYEIFKALDDAKNLINVSNHIAVMNYYEGDIRLAMENFKKTVELRKHHQTTERLADLYGNIGTCYMKVGDYDNALRYYDRALEMADKSDFPDYVNALAYNNKAQIYRYRQNYSNSILYYRKALELNRKIKNRQWESYNLYNLSEVYVDIGDYEKAIACVRDSLEIEKRINNKVNIIDCLTLLAHYHILQKELEKAEEYLTEASKVLRGIDYSFGKMQIYIEHGFVRHERGEFAIRDQYFEKSISINPKDGIYEITKYLCRIGEIEEAKKYLQMAIEQQIKITRFSESDKAFDRAIKDPEFWELLRQVFDYDPTF